MNYIIIVYCILAITIILLVLNYKYNKYSNSINYNMETFEPIDRTRLYSSLFLDNLNE